MDAIAEEEKTLGNWPRRLLHVPTLTSYAWQPGNIYGGTVNPVYNAITYTWGRWRLRDEPLESPEVTALPIRGVDWALPRIDPQHFSLEQFEHVVRSTVIIQPSSLVLRLKLEAPSQIEFLWLDIACIDQRPGEPRAAAEIGRQAAIFKGANTVFSWLTTHSRDRLQRYLDSIDLFTVLSVESTSNQAGMISDMASFLSDPWFSSLWTLQEAFLRPDAFLLSKDGELLSYPKSMKSIDNPDLQEVIGWSESWYNMCRDKQKGLKEPNIYASIVKTIEDCGLNALASFNAIGTYEAAMKRTTLLSEDRIYGIQQIFGFRLGKSAVNENLGRHFTFNELEDQLGEAMMKHYPVVSQWHTFTKPVPKHKRWRINECSVVPLVSDHGHTVWESSQDDIPYCRFWVDRSSKSESRVYFEGRLTAFESLVEACRKVPQEELFSNFGRLKNMLRVVPDMAEELEDVPIRYGKRDANIFVQEQQRHIIDWLTTKFTHQTLQVLLLGPSSGERYSYMLGLMLLNDDDGSWKRLGVCQWETSDLQVSDVVSSQMEYLSGDGSEWESCEGLFGSISGPQL